MNKCSRISKPMTGNSENSKSVEICRSSSNENNQKNDTSSNSSKSNSNSSDSQPRFLFLATAFFLGRELGSDRVFFFARPRFFFPATAFFLAGANF